MNAELMDKTWSDANAFQGVKQKKPFSSLSQAPLPASFSACVSNRQWVEIPQEQKKNTRRKKDKCQPPPVWRLRLC